VSRSLFQNGGEGVKESVSEQFERVTGGCILTMERLMTVKMVGEECRRHIKGTLL